ncbi:hypothetical protein ABVK25_007159 [Lepraria finkii]|uniref:ferric-chelate reductase (NADPH) n=1 Tax=Lepraria finkii TaxID=1340010 RepID=A0ABR4B429_9LECA
MQQMPYLQTVIAIWVAERALRLISLVYRNLGRTYTHAEADAPPGDAVAITIRLARPVTFKPGQHIFVTLPPVGLWANHPFSLAWSETTTTPASYDLAKGSKTSQITSDVFALHQTTVSLIIRSADALQAACIRSAKPHTVRASPSPLSLKGPMAAAKSSIPTAQ